MSTNEQLITILPDGTMTGLQMKPGKGIDLREFGAAEIVRASDIKFSASHQAWFIELATGKHRGKVVGLDTAAELMADPTDGDMQVACEVSAMCVRFETLPTEFLSTNDGLTGDPVDATFYFKDYDQAVGFEVAFLNLMRERDPQALTCE